MMLGGRETMPAFKKTTDLFNYFRRKAQEFGCNPRFDSKIDDIHAMNEKGSNGVPGCLCSVKFVPCPCGGALKQIEKNGECHCEIFVRKK